VPCGLRRVVNFFACLIGIFGRPQSVAAWKIVSSYLLWCLWRKEMIVVFYPTFLVVSLIHSLCTWDALRF
jgi:hypothetical protein